MMPTAARKRKHAEADHNDGQDGGGGTAAEAHSGNLAEPNGGKGARDNGENPAQMHAGTEQTELPAGPVASTDPISGAQISAALRTTSYDALRQTLLTLRNATSLAAHDERLSASDARIQLAKELVYAGGLGTGVDAGGSGAPSTSTSAAASSTRGLFDAWDLADAQQQLAVLPLPLFALANLLTLFGAHQPDHAVGEEILVRLLPPSNVPPGGDEEHERGSGHASHTARGRYWTRLQAYLASTDTFHGVTAGAHSKTNDASKGKGVVRTNRDAEILIMATLRLLLAMTSFAGAKFARPIFDAMGWSMKSLPRLATKRRRAHVKQRDRKAAMGKPNAQVTLDRPDIRTLWVLFLLSFLRTPSGGSTAPALRIAALGLGKDYYPAILKGLGQDPAPVVAHILLGLHDGILSDEASAKLPRSSIVSLFNEWGCKELVSLYEREHDRLQLTATQDSHSIADVAHHFLLALCTHPGRGVCYADNGWYGRQTPDEGETDGGGAHAQQRPSIHNKILYGVLRSLSPSRSPKQAELALRILGASSELVGLYLLMPSHMEPKPASVSWLSSATFIGRVLSLPLPAFRGKDDQWMSSPPPLTSCVDAIFPASLGRNALARGISHSDRLARYACLNLLVRLLNRLQAFKGACSQAASDLGQSDEGSVDYKKGRLSDYTSLPTEQDVLCGRFGFDSGAKSPWLSCWTEIAEEARLRLPEVSVLIESSEQSPKDESNSNATDSAHLVDTRRSSVLLELALRCAWLQISLLRGDAEDVSAIALDRLLQITMTTHDTGAVDTQGDESSRQFELLSRLHALRIISLLVEGQSRRFDLLSRAPSSPHTYACHMLHMQWRGASALPMLETTSKQIVASAMSSSMLFEHDTTEWQAWEFSLDGSEPVVCNFMDECLQRCLKTPYRYIEIGRKLTSSSSSKEGNNDAAEGNWSGGDGLPASPLLFTMLEQYSIRLKKGLLDAEEVSLLKASFLIFLSDLLPALAASKRARQASLGSCLREVEACVKDATKDTASAGLLFALDVLQSKVHAVMPEESPFPSSTSEDVKGKAASSIGTSRPHSADAIKKALAQPKNVTLLTSLHPCLENALDRRVGVDKIPARIAAFHIAYANKVAVDCVDWSNAEQMDAKLLYAVARWRLLRHGDVPVFERLVPEAYVRGLLDNAFLQQHLFNDSALLSRCRKDDDVFDALVALATRLGLDPDSEGDRATLEPLVDIAKGRMSARQSEECVWPSLKLAPFLSQSDRQQAILQSIEYGTSISLVAEAVCLCDVLALSSSVLVDLLSNVNRLDPLEASSTLSLLSHCKIVSTPDTRDGANDTSVQKLVEFVLSVANVSGADVVLCTLLDVQPSASSQILAHVTEKSSATEGLNAAEALPFALNKSVAVARMLADGQAAPSFSPDVIRICASAVFNSNPQVSIPTAVAARCISARDTKTVIQALVASIPTRPGEAFRATALLLAADLGADGDSGDFRRSLIEKALLWLVRRFAEDAEDTADTLDGVQALISLLQQSSEALGRFTHLVGPVVTAAIKNRMNDAVVVQLVGLLLSATPLKDDFRQSAIDTMLHSRAAFANKSVADEVVNCVHACVMASHAVLDKVIAGALVSLYSGTLSVLDRKVMQILQVYEASQGFSLLDALASWQPKDTDTSLPTLDSNASTTSIVWRLDPVRAHETCLKFPRGRGFQDVVRSGFNDECYAVEQLEASVYDPLLVLGALGSFLADQRHLGGLQCIELMRTNVLGVVCCSLSSTQPDVRNAAAILLAQAYGAMQHADFFEKDQLLVIFDALRNAYVAGQNASNIGVAPLPLTTTLFAAHSLRAIAHPSLYLYPPISRFLLQRAAPLDQSDVPLLYSFLYASSQQSPAYRQERLFILRYVTASLRFGGRSDWRVMKRRHVWHAVCSLYLATMDAGVLRAIEDLWEAAAHKKHVAMSVVLRQGFLDFVQQILVVRPSRPGHGREADYWLRLMAGLVRSLDLARVHSACGSTWLASLCRVAELVIASESSAASGSVSAATIAETLDGASRATLLAFEEMLVKIILFVDEYALSAVDLGQRNVDILAALADATSSALALFALQNQTGGADEADHDVVRRLKSPSHQRPEQVGMVHQVLRRLQGSQ